MKASQQLTILRQEIIKRDHQLVEKAALATHAAIVKHLDQDRVLVPGGEEGFTLGFARVGATILKVSSQSIKGQVRFNVARNIVTYQPDAVNVSIVLATEADLLDAQKAVAINGSGADQVAIREFLRAVRNEPVQPLQIEIVNASEVGTRGKAVKILRDDATGKISGAISQALPASLEE